MAYKPSPMLSPCTSLLVPHTNHKQNKTKQNNQRKCTVILTTIFHYMHNGIIFVWCHRDTLSILTPKHSRLFHPSNSTTTCRHPLKSCVHNLHVKCVTWILWNMSDLVAYYEEWGNVKCAMHGTLTPHMQFHMYGNGTLHCMHTPHMHTPHP